MKEKARAYIQLTRPYGFFITMIIVLGAICNNEFDFFHLLILLLIGIFVHIGLMVQNDYFDIEIDKKSKAYPLAWLRTNPGVLSDQMGEERIKIEVNQEGEVVSVKTRQGKMVPAIFAYWFAWQAFHTNTEVFKK